MAEINEISRVWWHWMGPMLWQVSLLIVLISGLDILLRRWAWPQVRYALWLLVLVKLLIPPSWSSPSSLISHVRPRVQQSLVTKLGTQIPEESTGEPVAARRGMHLQIPIYDEARPSEESGTESPSPPLAESSVQPTWQTYAVALWLIGMLLFFGVLVAKMFRLRRWHQQHEERSVPRWFHELLVKTAERFRLQRLPAIVFSNQATTPAVYGVFRPVMLLPAGYFEHLSRQEAEHVLLHELAHLKRGDLWLHGLCLLLQIVYWFNPLMLWVRRQMKHVREICCDLTVANTLREGTVEYRRTLLNTARELLTETVEPGLGLLGVFEEPFRLVSRLRWLEKNTWRNRHLMLAVAFGVAMLMAACILPMAGAKQTTDRTPSLAVDASQAQTPPSATITSASDVALIVTLKRKEPLYAAVLPMAGSYDQLEEGLKTCRKLLDGGKVKRTGDPFARYFSDPESVPESRQSWEVGFPVPAGSHVELPLEIIQVSSQQVASATIEGVKNTDPVWPRFIESIQNQSLVPAYPPAVEVFRGEADGREFWWRTELQIQAFRPLEGYPGLQIVIHDVEPFTAVVLPMQGSYVQHPEALRKLNDYVQRKGIRTVGDLFGRYFSDPTKVTPPEYVWEVGYPVDQGTQVEPPFELRQIDGGSVGSALLPGPPELEYPWAPFLVQMILQGYIPIATDGAMEIWHGGVTKSGEEGPTVELRIQAASAEEFGEGMAAWGKQFGEQMRKWGEGEKEQVETSEFPDRSDRDVSFKQTKEFYALALPMRGSYQKRAEGFERLQAYMKEKRIRPTGDWFCRYLNSPERVEEEELIWEIGVPIEEMVKVERPFVARAIPAQYVAYRVVRGDEDPWPAFFRAVREKDAVPMGVGMEVWINDSGEGNTRELRIPIVRDRNNRSTLRASITQMDSFTAAVLPMKGSYDQLESGLKRLQELLRSQGIEATGDPFARGFNDPDIALEDDLLWELGCPVSPGTHVQPPLQLTTIPSKKVASTSMEGFLDHVPVWKTFVQEIFKEGYAPAYPNMVIWHTDLDSIGKSFHTTEFVFSLRERRADTNPIGAKDTGLSFRIKETGAFDAIVLPFEGTGEQIYENMRRVQGMLQGLDIKPTGPAFIRQFTPAGMIPEHERIWEVGYPIPEGTRVQKPFEIRHLPAARVTYIRVTGTFDEDNVNQEWARWIYKNLYWASGPAMIYCPDRLYHPAAGRPEWEIQVPIERIEGAYPEVEVFTQWAKPMIVMVLPMQGPDSGEQGALDRVRAYLDEIGVPPAGPPLLRYFNDDKIFPEDELLWEVGFPVPAGTSARSPFQIKEIPGGLVVHTTVQCDEEAVDTYWKAFALLAQSEGYFITGAPTRILISGNLKGVSVNEFRHPVRQKRHTPQKLPVF